MRAHCVALFLAVALPASAAAADSVWDSSGAEQGDRDWAKVERLRLRQTIRVLDSDQRSRTGRLTRVSADALTLDVNGVEQKTPRSEVLRIEVKSRTRSALIGLGIGAPAGLGFGYIAGSRANLKSGEKTAAAGLGAGLFAAAGAGIGTLAPSWKTVYRGEPSGSPSRNPAPPK
jgi:hypothetical protein